MVATKADCSIWLNHSLRTEASPKTRSNSGSSAARSSRVSFTSKTQTLFTKLPSPNRFAEISTHRRSRLRDMADKAAQPRAEVLTSEGRRPERADQLKCYLGTALQAERLACLIRGGRLSVEHLAEGYGLLDQFGVRLRALFAAEAEVVFQADPHVAAEHQAHRGEVVLGRVADAGRGPGVVLPEQVRCRAAHMHQLLDGRRVRTHHAEDELDVDRGVQQVPAEQVFYVVEVPDVIGF